MQTIHFLPDRLNVEPAVFRGFTTPELGLVVLTGAGLGLLWPLPLLPLTGWVIIPTGMMVTPLLLVWFGGSWITRMKRGKPDNWLWQRLEEKKCRAGMGRSSLIMVAQGWSLRRTRPVRRVL